MKNNTKIALLSLSMLLLVTSCGRNITSDDIDPAVLMASITRLNERSNSYDKSYAKYISDVNEKYGDKYLTQDARKEIIPQGIKLSESLLPIPENSPSYAIVAISNDTINFEIKDFDASMFGRYRLELEYYIPTTFAAAPIVKVYVNNEIPFTEAETVTLPLLYEDNVKFEEDGRKNFNDYTNKYNDQMTPTQQRHLIWQNEGLYESQYITSEPIIFDLDTVNPVISITNLSSDAFYVGKLTLKPVEESKSYNTYRLLASSQSQGNDNIELNAIEYSYKNTNDITLTNEQSPAVTPYAHDRKLLNVTSGWDQSGQSISWTVNVDSAGFYPMVVHYYNGNDNFPIFRKISINGEVPFKEVENYSFKTTGSHYDNVEVCDDDGNPYLFYLHKGENTITLTSTFEPVIDIYDNLMAIYDDINDFSIQIRKITGASIDSNKDYRITEYFPTTLSVLQSYKNIILDSRNKIKKVVGNDESSSSLSYFQRMLELVNELIEDPDDLPLKLSKFSSGDNCLAKLVADTANTLQSTNMILDTIYMTNDSSKIRPSNASWTSSLYSSLVTLGQTFTSDKYKTILKDGELNIWSARSQAYNDILQTYADNEFTPNTVCKDFPEGIKVNIRQMPSEDNLIYAYAADVVPDLVLGINSGRAFEFALRGDAALPLSDFDESWKYTNNNHWNFTPYYWDVVEHMPRGQLMSMLYNDKFYSVPESTSTQLMFSRDDIMNVLGDNNQRLPLPNTWDEVIGILTRLQGSGMNFYYTASASGSLKGLASTAQFILQNNGTILTPDGRRVNFRDPKTYYGIELLTNLYTIYALPTEVGSFYNHFRYGTYPLGIGDLGMYLQLKYVAPELLGKWSVSLIPGIKQTPQEDGTYADLNGDGVGDEISRWFISNGSSTMIFKNSKLIDEAWLFLQWWMSKDIQEAFTAALQSAFGPSVLWFSANLEAAESLPIDSDVRQVVLEQVKWITDLQQIPGQYMLARGLSDVWNSVVMGTSSSGLATSRLQVGEAIDLQKVVVDREIQRKMEEFGYYTSSNQRAYILRDYNWVESCYKNFKNNVKGGNTATSSCPI